MRAVVVIKIYKFNMLIDVPSLREGYVKLTLAISILQILYT